MYKKSIIWYLGSYFPSREEGRQGGKEWGWPGRSQGPAGSEVPDLPAFSAADVNSEDVATTSEATLGIHGPAGGRPSLH